MRNIRTCIVCGKQYEFCTGCRKSTQPTWLTIFHDQNCHDLWNAITTVYDREGAVAAANILSDLDLSGIDGFRADVKNKIEKIFDEAFADDDQETSDDDASEEVVDDDDWNAPEED